MDGAFRSSSRAGRPARQAVALALPLLALACHAPSTVATHTMATKTEASASPAASPGSPAVLVTSASPSSQVGATTPAAVPSARPEALLPPTGANQVLTGHVSLDATSLGLKDAVSLAVAGAALAAPAGGSIVTNNGAGVVANNGASLVVGGNVVSFASGNAIPGVGSGVDPTVGGAAFVTAAGRLLPSGGLVSDNGGAIVANNGGNVIANNGAGLIGNNSAGLVSNNAGNRRLLDASVPASGALPIAGALVSAVSLKTHQYLPVGVNAAGKPIYSVFTDLSGAYKLYLPPAEAGTVLVAIGAAPKAGTGVQYNTLVTPSTQAATTTDVNEDADIATQSTRAAFVDNMALILTSSTAGATLTAGFYSLPTLQTSIQLFADVVNAHAQQDGVPQGPGADRIPAVHALAAVLCDGIIGSGDQSKLQLSPLFDFNFAGSPESVQSALAASAKALRLETAAYMAVHKPPTSVSYALDERTVLTHALAPYCPELVSVPLESDTDLVAFAFSQLLLPTSFYPSQNFSRAYLAVAVPAFPAVTSKIDAASPAYYTDPVNHLQLTYGDRVRAAFETISGAIGLAMVGDPTDTSSPTLASVLDVTIDAFVKSHDFTATPQPVPTPSFLITPCATPATAATGATGAS